jgi:tetratricopeptide (TPR) repeat protein
LNSLFQFLPKSLILKNRGEYDQALKLHNESLEIKRQLGDQRGISQSLGNIANIHYYKGEYDQALKLHLPTNAAKGVTR